MKDHAMALVARESGTRDKLNILREYLQAYVLRTLHDHGFFRTTAFLGGTALRFLYNLPRFSEDLDFSASERDGKPLSYWLDTLKRELPLAGYSVTISSSDRNAVHSAFINFRGLLYSAELSPLRDQNLSVKLEIDTRPPAGAGTTVEIVNKYFPLSFLTYDRPSLFAGKTHAILSRRYAKGRDFFDLGWYLSRWKELTPNMVLLRNALEQTGWQGEMPTDETWRKILARRIADADWKKIRQDVEPFLERPSDLAIVTREAILHLLEG